MAADFDLTTLLETAVEESARFTNPLSPWEHRWTEEEDAFLHENAGVLYDAEIAARLGRTHNAVKVRRTRAALPAPRYHDAFLTANQAAEKLGLDQHKIVAWIDSGLLTGETYQKQNTEVGTTCASGMYIRRIRLLTFKRWITRPAHWIYFDPRTIPDPELSALVQRAYTRWGDEWWTVRQLCDYHGLKDARWVGQKLHRGEIPGLQAFNLGGRHPDAAWSYWFIRKSDALRARFIHGKGNAQRTRAAEQTWSPRADAWIIRARTAGMTFVEIAARMGPQWNAKRVTYRYKLLTKGETHDRMD